MSLLMDALKRAEQEKREAARKLDDSGSGPQLESGPAGNSATAQPYTSRASASGSAPREMALEPVSGEYPGPVDVDSASSPGAPPVAAASEDENVLGQDVTTESPLALQLNTSQPNVEPPKFSPSGLADQIIAEEDNALDMTFHGVSLNEPPPASVPGMYDNTVQGEMGSSADEGSHYDETLPGVSAIQLARDIGTRDQPTPVAAETVFTAGRSRVDSSSGLKWVLGGLTVVMLIAAGIWYFLTVTPVTRNVPSPWVARGIESVPAVQSEAGVPLTGGTEIPGAVPVPEAKVAPEAGVPTSVTSGNQAVVPASTTEPVVADTKAAEPANSASPSGDNATEPVVLDLAPAPVAARPAGSAISATAPPLVRINREPSITDQERLVREAYGLYQAADFAGAQALYSAVLDQAPDNIDALLGHGAIALRKGDIAGAVETHGRVLRLDPDNGTALAVLVGLNKSADLNAAESAINTLIKESPEQAFLYFTLGNIYAAQQRWPESQSSFFDAHRLDSSNPDYALNLAVSLDRIGQRQPALDYYNTALRLAEHRPAGFDPSAILARIQSLSSSATP